MLFSLMLVIDESSCNPPPPFFFPALLKRNSCINVFQFCILVYSLRQWRAGLCVKVLIGIGYEAVVGFAS